MRESTLEHLTAPAEDPTRGREPLTLHPLAWEGDHVTEGVLSGPDGRWWWIAGGVPRLLPPGLYRNPVLAHRHGEAIRRLGLEPPPAPRGGALERLACRTIDRFGAEWLAFRDWGYLREPPAGADAEEYRGGLWANTLSAFTSKTFLPGRLDGRLVLDAGCGNGRFTAAALEHGAREVIAVDIGWGVDATFERHRADPRVHVVQASLFELPVRRVEAAFSLGVLMHTGDAARAFTRIAAAVEPGGLLAVRLYHQGNWVYETLDRTIRSVTTRLGKPAQMRLASRLARLGRWVRERERRGRPGLSEKWYRILHHWPTVHHNLDWWSAPIATHHTAPEVASWGERAGLRVVRADPPADRTRYGFWEWPEALTVLLERPHDALWLAEPRMPGAAAPERSVA